MLLVFDIDGTLLTSSHTLLMSTKKAIDEMMRKGHVVVLASSRPPRSVKKVASMLVSEVSFLIALNGALILDSNTVLYECSIESSCVTSIISAAREKLLHISLYSEWDWLIDSQDRWSVAEARVVGFDPTVVSDLMDLAPIPIHKSLVIGEESKVYWLKDKIESLGLNLNLTLSKPSYCEIVASRASKAFALQYAAKFHKIPLENTLAFGDGENDLEMLKIAGCGIAMGNAMPQVVSAADFVTTTNDNGGIANALIQLGFLRKEQMYP